MARPVDGTSSSNAEAIQGRRDSLVLATKFGNIRGPEREFLTWQVTGLSPRRAKRIIRCRRWHDRIASIEGDKQRL
jgi:hypothetical protein